jgi:hypothetical protein
VGGPGESGLAIQQRAAVERGEQPLVRVDDERVGVLDPGVQAPNGWRCKTRPAVRPVDVEPDAEIGADLRHGVEIVDRAEVCRARRRDHREEGLGSLGLQDRSKVVATEPLVLIAADADELGVHDLACRCDR